MSASEAAGIGERTVVVYWPESADPNIAIGLSQRLWGFRQTRIEKSGRLATFRLIQPGDLCVFARVDGGPRVGSEQWLAADVTFLTLAVVTWVQEGATEIVWPLEDGERFPYRIGIEPIETREQIPAAEMDAAWKDALRRSAFSGGSPVVLGDADPASLIAAPGAPASLTLDGPTDARVTTLRRLEQGRIRTAILGAAPSAQCALCERQLPVRHVRMAHIKQRAHCSEDERADWQNNVMVACVECDALFERGDLFVDPEGRIRTGVAPSTPDLDRLLRQRAERVCPAFTAESAPYFAHRRASHGH